MINRFVRFLCLILALCLCAVGCAQEQAEDGALDEPIDLNMNTDFKLDQSFPAL